ncbi:MAG: bifunctional glutamate N-acetyltransferase/amino-acid acetyltransferase ArgJ [Clostridia bacterium]|nr:bifunctional glutamate N-acetyltransferase/amino-acid acetyltransferase ArgJ [Clostridia bacterium]
MNYINGGVCAAKGFKAGGVHCGIRKNKDKKDLALIFSEVRASAAAIYTLNLVKGATIAVTCRNLSDGAAQAVICNSGNANTCNADGETVAAKMCGLAGNALGIPASDVIVASTGVIGVPLDITPIENSMDELVSSLGEDNSAAAAEAIMTTDTIKKEVAVEFELGGKTCRMGGIAKGSGMIHPNLGTMLVFITTDTAVSPEMLDKAIRADAEKSFNMVSIDGDTSTNDTVAVMANGMAGNPEITAEGEDFEVFKNALGMLTERLCRMIAGDGEGATKLIECRVANGPDWHTSKTAAKAVICSSLTKAAMFGADANWGRVLCAIGYSGADVDVNKIDVTFRSIAGEVPVCKDGAGIEFSEELAKLVLSEDEIIIDVDLKSGGVSAVARGCDLTYDYVRINGDYRT